MADQFVAEWLGGPRDGEKIVVKPGVGTIYAYRVRPVAGFTESDGVEECSWDVIACPVVITRHGLRVLWTG